jgi:hypothetical protein
MYLAVFGWVGVFCSCTARTTLIASIRVMMAGIFLSGGFWFVLICCCFMPMSLGSFRGNDGPEIIATFFAALSPPFVMGWLPLNSFDKNAMGPFHPDERPHFGVLAVAVGFFIWAFFGVMTAIASMKAFQKQANRIFDGLPESQTVQEKKVIEVDEY